MTRYAHLVILLKDARSQREPRNTENESYRNEKLSKGCTARRGDFSGVGDIHFFYSAEEVLYGALPDFEAACRRANVPYTALARAKTVHYYCMLPYFREAKEDFARIAAILKK